jgi:succinoglycan biosynthesis transport protein ExoP
LRRIRESYKSDYEIASEAEKRVEERLRQAIAESQTSNEAQVTLRGLETSSQTYKTVHDNFVKRYTEATEQQSFPYTEARLITKATPPIKRTYRKSLLIAAMTPLMGLVLGVGLGALRDFADRGFRTSTQIESILGLPCVALIPLQEKSENKADSQPAPGITRASPGVISLGVASSVVEQPFSRFAEAIRTIKLAAELNGIVAANKVVGITSTIPDEGKSTLAAALALSIAQVGGRGILVDCDLRNPSLSRAITPNTNAGILEVLSGKIALDEVLNREAYLSMTFLPVVSKVRIADSSELLSSSAMKRLFERLRHSYDYVIVDLPPLAPLADVRATTHLVDAYLLVAEWGRTSTTVVQHALSRTPRVFDKIIGTVLNKVDVKALSLYDGNSAGYYYDKAYGRYGYSD